MKKIIVAMALIFLCSQQVLPHCEIPCGIYGDEERIKAIAEHIETIEKSMKKITEFSKEKEINYNQLVRWVNNKESHANYIQEIVTQYFMAQRIKVEVMSKENEEVYNKYILELTTLHGLLVSAMKAKQSTDLAVITELRSLLIRFEASYFGVEMEPVHL